MLLLVACAADVATVEQSTHTREQCNLTEFGSLREAMDTCAEVILNAGDYVIPVVARRASVDVRSSITCRDGAVIRFVGTALLGDWAGFLIGPNNVGVRITNCKFDGNSVLEVNEHSPLIQVRGPNIGTRIDHNEFIYPEIAGVKRGDCVQNIGYPTGQYIDDIRVDHNRFHACARVGVAFHSGTRGRIDHNTFTDTGRAADLDGEGSGFNTLEIDHNRIDIGPNSTSALALNVQADTGHRIHDNVFGGKGINLYGCANCELADNVTSFTQLSTGPVLGVYKLSPYLVSHDNVYSRSASALPGFVLHIARKLDSAPTRALFQDDVFLQMSNWTTIQSLGIDGMKLDRCEVTTVAERVPVWDAEGIGARTTNLEIEHSTFTGGSPVMAVSGSYQGTGSITIVDSTATSNVQKAVGLQCSSPTASSGIIGPIVFQRNAWPLNSCVLSP